VRVRRNIQWRADRFVYDIFFRFAIVSFLRFIAFIFDFAAIFFATAIFTISSMLTSLSPPLLPFRFLSPRHHYYFHFRFEFCHFRRLTMIR